MSFQHWHLLSLPMLIEIFLGFHMLSHFGLYHVHFEYYKTLGLLKSSTECQHFVLIFKAFSVLHDCVSCM